MCTMFVTLTALLACFTEHTCIQHSELPYNPGAYIVTDLKIHYKFQYHHGLIAINSRLYQQTQQATGRNPPLLSDALMQNRLRYGKVPYFPRTIVEWHCLPENVASGPAYRLDCLNGYKYYTPHPPPIFWRTPYSDIVFRHVKLVTQQKKKKKNFEYRTASPRSSRASAKRIVRSSMRFFISSGFIFCDKCDEVESHLRTE